MDDLGFLGNVEQEKTEINTPKENEIKDKWDEISHVQETREQKQMASLQKAVGNEADCRVKFGSNRENK